MAIVGVYNGSYIETDHKFEKNQRMILTPIERPKGPPDPVKKALIEELYGSVPDSGLSLEETKAERRNKQ